MIDATVMYGSVREEIVEQKKCQFHLFGVALTLTASVLAYAAASKVGPLVYVAPMLMNLLSLLMIMDKAVSIQRMVGYLQLMENGADKQRWKWEYHLNFFREAPCKPAGSEPHRKHNYIRNVAAMLVILNAVCAALYAFGPDAVALRKTPDYQSMREFYGAAHLLVIVLLTWGVVAAFRRWHQLVNGQYTSAAIRGRWMEVLQEDARRQQGGG